MKNIKLIHDEWEDYIILDFKNNKLVRNSKKDETGSFNIDKNILYIKWDKWNDEIFINHDLDIIKNNESDKENYSMTSDILETDIKNEQIIKDLNYFYCKEIEFIHENWNDYCYIDNKNNIIYKKSFDKRGVFYTENENNKNSEKKIINIYWQNIENEKLVYNYKKVINNETENSIINKYYFNKKKNINKYKNKIPNIIHFIYGLKIQDEEFDMYKYIAIKSAIDVNNPEKIYFYYYYEPYGYWWEKIKSLLILEKIIPPNEIYGNKVSHYAHQTDIIRLQKLIEHGGIYLDIDTICLKSFEDLLNNDFVMGMQYNSDFSEVYGLCNAVLLGKPNSSFAIKWLESYKSFRSNGRDNYWDEHSVLKPLELSKIYNNEVTILNSNAFFYPLWYNIKDILFNIDFNIEIYKNIIKNNYCIHLWDTYSNEYLKLLNSEIIFSKNTLYNIFSRKFLQNKISILFLTYNRYEVTKKCLDSYLKCLENKDILELIILDNNSDSETSDYLISYKKNNEKIKLILYDENLGVCHGRLLLFNEAKGDIIISLDSDAYLLNTDFFNKIKHLLYNEKYGIIGISGAYISKWEFGNQIDIPENDENEYYVDHIAGCCQAFRKDLFLFGFGLDPYYGKFWVEDTDLSMQSLSLNKINYRINHKNLLEHSWGGSGKNFEELFEKNWSYFVSKWKDKVELSNKI
jgi:hypothetical protein